MIRQALRHALDHIHTRADDYAQFSLLARTNPVNNIHAEICKDYIRFRVIGPRLRASYDLPNSDDISDEEQQLDVEHTSRWDSPAEAYEIAERRLVTLIENTSNPSEVRSFVFGENDVFHYN